MKNNKKVVNPSKLSVRFKKSKEDLAQIDAAKPDPKNNQLRIAWCQPQNVSALVRLYRRARAYWGRAVLPYR